MESSLLNSGFITAEKWKQMGNLIPVFDKEIFTIDIGENENCLVILHGYLTSSYDYYKVIHELSKTYRVIIHDLIGFGYSDKSAKQYFTITDQVDYLLQLWKQLNLNHITLLGHDYGTALAQEIFARQNAHLLGLQIKEFIYCNGNLPINYSYFLDNQEFLKSEVSKKIIAMLASFGLYKRTISEVFYDKNNISEDELKQMWIQLEHNNGRKVIHFIYNYIRERKIFWNRWVTAIKETNIPTKIIWGKKDPLTKEVVPENLSHKLDKNKIFWIEQAGHFPMLENPREFISAILKTD